MNDADYMDAQNALLSATMILRRHDWPSFIARADETLSVGWALDPTLYRQAYGFLERIRSMAIKANELLIEDTKPNGGKD